MTHYPKVTRVEVIDHANPEQPGRSFVARYENADVSVSIQDNGRTMKVFIEKDRKSVV